MIEAGIEEPPGAEASGDRLFYYAENCSEGLVRGSLPGGFADAGQGSSELFVGVSGEILPSDVTYKPLVRGARQEASEPTRGHAPDKLRATRRWRYIHLPSMLQNDYSIKAQTRRAPGA